MELWRLRHDGGYSEDQLPDAIALDLIKRASKLIEELTGWFFEAREKVVRLDGNGRRTIYLPYPLISLDSLTVDGEPVSPDEVVIYSGGDDRFDPRLYRDYRWPKGRQNVVIVGKWGFVEEDGSPPEAIQTACLMLVRWLLKTPEERRRVSQESAEGAQVIYEKDGRFAGYTGDPDIDSLLVRYTRPPAMEMV